MISKLDFQLLWIDISCGIEEWLLKLTANFRLKHTKKLILKDHAYFDWTGEYQTIDMDVDIYDQWGFWLPYGFELVSKKAWELENDMNRKLGHPEEPWRDVDDRSKDWTYYYTKNDYITIKDVFQLSRKYLKKVLGDKYHDKDLEVCFLATSQKWMDEQLLEEAEWVKAGKPKRKVEFTDKAKEGFKDIMGDEKASKMFEEHEKKNLEIDAENQRKLDEEKKRREDDEKQG